METPPMTFEPRAVKIGHRWQALVLKDDMLTWECSHGHRDREIALGCARAQIIELAETAVSAVQGYKITVFGVRAPDQDAARRLVEATLDAAGVAFAEARVDPMKETAGARG
jgi:hypothetical protein